MKQAKYVRIEPSNNKIPFGADANQINYSTNKTLDVKLNEINNAVAAISNKITETKTQTQTIVNRIKTKTSAMEQEYKKNKENLGHVYGIKRKVTNNSNPKWKRIYDSIGLYAEATKDGSEVYNDFDNIAPWSLIRSCNYNYAEKVVTAWIGEPGFKFDGSNGDVYTYIPTTYWKIYREDDYEYILLADHAKEGFTKVNHFYISRYLLTAENQTAPIASKSDTITRPWWIPKDWKIRIKNLSNDLIMMDWRYYIIQMLYLVEYANYNGQEELGKGRVSYLNTEIIKIDENNLKAFVVSKDSIIVKGTYYHIGTTKTGGGDVTYDNKIIKAEKYNQNGVEGIYVELEKNPNKPLAAGQFLKSAYSHNGDCDELKMCSGCLGNDMFHSIIYRGVENIYGNCWQWVDGIIQKKNKFYYCNEPQYYDNEVNSHYKEFSYEPYTRVETIKSVGLDNGTFVRLPTDTGATGSHLYLCDSNRVPGREDEKNYLFVVGGNMWSNLEAGWNAIYTVYPDSPYWGATTRIIIEGE